MATMSRQHFNLIADTIDRLTLDADAHRHVAMEFAAALADTNPYFDYHRFLNACGVES